MAASCERAPTGRRIRLARSVSVGFGLVLMAVVFASWWLTEPLTDRGGPISSSGRAGALEVEVVAPAAPKPPPTWPADRLAGEAAKIVLLDALLAAAKRLEAVPGYTATFHKQERIGGTLRPRQTLKMKTRHHPFAVYFKFVTPTEGREVVYAEGHHDNKVIAHSVGVARLLVPRLAVPPDHPLAMADSRHAITEAGLANLTAKLIHFRKLDLNDSTAHTVLDRFTDDNQKTWLRSIHTHETYHEDRPFARVDVLYDPETFLPMDIRNYDWPEPGQSQSAELLLAEHYTYENLDLSADLTSLDFDPANPAYAFHR